MKTHEKVMALGGMVAVIGGTAWACSVGSPVAYGAAPASTTNILQTIFGGGLSLTGIVTTIIAVLKSGVLGGKAGSIVTDISPLMNSLLAGKTDAVGVTKIVAISVLYADRVHANDDEGRKLVNQIADRCLVVKEPTK